MCVCVFLKPNENLLNGIPLIPGEEIIGATFNITDVIAVSANDKIGVSALAIKIK